MAYRPTIPNVPQGVSIRKFWFVPAILFAIILIPFLDFTAIDATEHCVKLRYGNVINQKMEPGLRSTIFANVECLPTTRLVYPSLVKGAEEATSYDFSTQSADSVQLDGSIAFEYEYTDPFAAFMDKRSHQAVVAAFSNQLPTAVRNTGATIRLSDLYGPKREALSGIFQENLQRVMPPYVRIVSVSLKKLDPPGPVRNAFQAAVTQRAEQQKARDKYLADSISARSTILLAETEARRVELENRAKATSPALLEIERARAAAELLKNCKENCFVGGDVLQRYFSIAPRGGNR